MNVSLFGLQRYSLRLDRDLLGYRAHLQIEVGIRDHVRSDSDTGLGQRLETACGDSNVVEARGKIGKSVEAARVCIRFFPDAGRLIDGGNVRFGHSCAALVSDGSAGRAEKHLSVGSLHHSEKRESENHCKQNLQICFVASP